MRGHDPNQQPYFNHVSPDSRVPKDHPTMREIFKGLHITHV